MQRVCAVPGGVNTYLSDPDCLLTDETRRCPFCKAPHPLHRHGDYQRWALLPGEECSRRFSILRLLCPAVGRTVSLLPDFCLPRREYGPAVLAIFLHALAVLRLPLLAAFSAVVPGATGRSTAGDLRDAFLASAHRIRSYVYSLEHRHVPAPPGTPARLRVLASLLRGLTGSSPCPGGAFVFHAAPFHERFRQGFV